jgi:glycosyltransferase involved in cell wall biosynthesis
MNTSVRSAPRICILTPGHLSTNPRLVKEADALVGAGYDVKVIAADFMQWARAADRIFADRAWHVIRTLPFGPEAPRAARAIQLLRQHSARLLVITGVWLPSIVRAAWHPIAPDLVAAAQRVPADLYIAHYPAALPAAAIAAHRHGGLYAFDAEDFHLGDRPEVPEHAIERRMVRAIEGRYLSGCAYVTAASPGIADAYAEAYGIVRPTVVLNVFPRVQAPLEPAPAGYAAPGPSVYWFSQTIGPDRGLECAVRAIGRAQSRPHLYLRGTPARGFLDRLGAIATEAGVADRIHTLPPAPPSEMERLAAVYDIGLAGETGHTPSRRIALTNKLFSYLLAGLPVALSDIPAHRAFAGEVGNVARLYAVDDAESLASALDWLLADPARLANTRAAAFNLGRKRFNWETERSTLLNCAETALMMNVKRKVARAGMVAASVQSNLS